MKLKKISNKKLVIGSFLIQSILVTSFVVPAVSISQANKHHTKINKPSILNIIKTTQLGELNFGDDQEIIAKVVELNPKLNASEILIKKINDQKAEILVKEGSSFYQKTFPGVMVGYSILEKQNILKVIKNNFLGAVDSSDSNYLLNKIMILNPKVQIDSLQINKNTITPTSAIVSPKERSIYTDEFIVKFVLEDKNINEDLTVKEIGLIRDANQNYIIDALAKNNPNLDTTQISVYGIDENEKTALISGKNGSSIYKNDEHAKVSFEMPENSFVKELQKNLKKDDTSTLKLTNGIIDNSKTNIINELKSTTSVMTDQIEIIDIKANQCKIKAKMNSYHYRDETPLIINFSTINRTNITEYTNNGKNYHFVIGLNNSTKIQETQITDLLKFFLEEKSNLNLIKDIDYTLTIPENQSGTKTIVISSIATSKLIVGGIKIDIDDRLDVNDIFTASNEYFGKYYNTRISTSPSDSDKIKNDLISGIISTLNDRNYYFSKYNKYRIDSIFNGEEASFDESNKFSSVHDQKQYYRNLIIDNLNISVFKTNNFDGTKAIVIIPCVAPNFYGSDFKIDVTNNSALAWSDQSGDDEYPRRIDPNAVSNTNHNPTTAFWDVTNEIVLATINPNDLCNLSIKEFMEIYEISIFFDWRVNYWDKNFHGWHDKKGKDAPIKKIKEKFSSFIAQGDIMRNSTEKVYDKQTFIAYDGYFDKWQKAAGAYQVYIVQENNNIIIKGKVGVWFDRDNISKDLHAAFSWIKPTEVVINQKN